MVERESSEFLGTSLKDMSLTSVENDILLGVAEDLQVVLEQRQLDDFEVNHCWVKRSTIRT